MGYSLWGHKESDTTEHTQICCQLPISSGALKGVLITPTFWFGSIYENSESDGNTRPPDCLLRNLYAGQEATVRTGHGTTDWFQIGKRVHQGCILSPCLFNLHAEEIMRNAELEEAHAGINVAGRNMNNLR